MKIYSVYDAEFSNYGQILTGYDTEELLKLFDEITAAGEGVDYVPSQAELETLPVAQEIMNRAYGGMPIEIGWCNGHNTKMNCLEYHRDSELNLGARDFILLLAKREDIKDGQLDSAKVKAFWCPAGTFIEVYATTLHYAPCSASRGAEFKTIVVLPALTNLEMPEIEVKNSEDELLYARNKWLLCHPDSDEAKGTGAVRIFGDNIDISDSI